jgi:hypothetical protein
MASAQKCDENGRESNEDGQGRQSRSSEKAGGRWAKVVAFLVEFVAWSGLRRCYIAQYRKSEANPVKFPRSTLCLVVLLCSAAADAQ